jgi:hypothetical protein
MISNHCLFIRHLAASLHLSGNASFELSALNILFDEQNESESVFTGFSSVSECDLSHILAFVYYDVDEFSIK